MTAGGPEVTRADSPRVFICYRREETAAHAGRLYDAMVARFGESNVFMDIDLAPGVDFVDRITEVVAECQVLIVVMGPRWATVEDDEGHVRIADPEDFVRIEVETALRHPDVTPIPVLVSGAKMPKREGLPTEIRAITRRNALELSEARWRYDVGRLNSRLDYLLADRPAPPGPSTAEESVAGREAAAAAPATQEAAPAESPPADTPPETAATAPPVPEPRSGGRARWIWILGALVGAAVIAVVVALVAGGGSGGAGTTADTGTAAETAIRVEHKPVGIIVAKQGIWVANRNSGTVTHLRPDGTKVKSIPVGQGSKPSGLAFGLGNIWVALAGSNSVIPIDPTSDKAGASIPVGTDPRAVGVGHGAVWVTNTGSGTVFRLDRHGNQVGTPITVGGGPRGVTVGPGGVWVSNGDGDSVSEISPDSQTVVKTIPLPKGTDPKGSAIAHGKLWVADEGSRTVTPIDVKAGAAENPISVGTHPRDVTFSQDTKSLYATNGGADSVSVIDPATGKVKGSPIPLPARSAPENVSAGLGKIWVAAGGTDKIISLSP